MRNWKSFEFWIGVVGILSAVFSVYTYVASKKVGRISYQIDTQKIFDPDSLVNFRLETSEGTRITHPVYASELVIWNSGDLSLGVASDRIRKPVNLQLGGNGVFQYFLVSRTTPGVNSAFEITLSDDRVSAEVKWKFFDPGQGIRVTFIHSGGDSSLAIGGKFFEAELSDEGSHHKPIDKVSREDALRLIRSFCFVGAAVYLLVAVVGLRRYLSSKSEQETPIDPRKAAVRSRLRTLGIAVVFGVLGVLMLGLGFALVAATHSPPI